MVLTSLLMVYPVTLLPLVCYFYVMSIFVLFFPIWSLDLASPLLGFKFIKNTVGLQHNRSRLMKGHCWDLD